MNDKSAPKTGASGDWEMSLPEISPPFSDTSVQPKSEDWAMSPPVLTQPQAETAEDWAMTNPLTMPPNASDFSKPATEWQLPAPVFRSSEGSTPKKLTVHAPPAAASTAAPKIESAPDELFSTPAPEIPSAAASAATAPPIAPQPPKSAQPPVANAIEPQPEIGEAFAVPILTPAPAPVVKPKNKILRIVAVAAALLLMLSVIIGFLIVVYYLFFHKTVVE